MDALMGRIRLMVGRGIINLVDDATQAQSLQVEMLSDEAQDGVERFQQYGFTSHPHAGAEAIVACAGGLRSHAIVISIEDRRYRLRSLQPGEVALYDDLGNVVKLARAGIEVTGIDKVTVTAPQVLVDSADVQLGGAGGQKVARIGDDVDLGTGKIISGSDKVTAA